jgi:molybdopterin converting factor small subunit
LPESLKVEKELKKGRSSVGTSVRRLRARIAKRGYLMLEGFYDASFHIDGNTISVGDKLNIKVGDVVDRVGALIAYNARGLPVGVITNG